MKWFEKAAVTYVVFKVMREQMMMVNVSTCCSHFVSLPVWSTVE